MTMPNEEKWTLEITKEFMLYIINDLKHPIKIRELRKKALRCLHHFPMQHRINKLFKNETDFEQKIDIEVCKRCGKADIKSNHECNPNRLLNDINDYTY